MRNYLIALLFFITHIAIAQNSQDILPTRYAKDTIGYTNYPAVNLLRHITTAKKYTKLEINTWYDNYMPRETRYRNLWRYPAKNMSDTILLSKNNPMKSFTACWCPNFYPWYISAELRDKRVLTIGDTSDMKEFLIGITNCFDAYLWLFSTNKIIDQQIPVTTINSYSYKKVKDGFLIRFNGAISNAPLTDATITYLVGKYFSVTLISKTNIVTSDIKI